jgi:hypothetical protein
MPAARPVQYCRYCLAILPRLALWAPGLLTFRIVRANHSGCVRTSGGVNASHILARAS